MTPVRKTTVIGGVVLLVMAAASWMFVLSPRSDAIAATNAEVDVAVAANDALRSQIVTRRALEARLPELRKVSKALDGRFPPTAEQPELYRMITAAAGRAGIAPGAVTNLTVSPPTAGTGGLASSAKLPGVATSAAPIYSQQINLDLRGTSLQIRRMARYLEELPRAFGVTSVSLSGGGQDADTGELTEQTASLTGQMFVLPEVADPTLAASKAKAKAKAKADAAAKAAKDAAAEAATS